MKASDELCSVSRINLASPVIYLFADGISWSTTYCCTEVRQLKIKWGFIWACKAIRSSSIIFLESFSFSRCRRRIVRIRQLASPQVPRAKRVTTTILHQVVNQNGVTTQNR